ncbi:RNB domain-containing ribonuclease [Actinoplanes derwentensis]|uniref:Exoribonuclease R n=1 Tax=Actinoplanes derwentensis TaxID=113562 RepID=A0A1H2C4S2_9ACTN|nr:RNB domain-containing ribonuclease [Actinoplanes derwentensis]GID84189.1 ribonuclease R [Actinoplanes derwentensis]SDT65441.1 Exoribonuclease R [Actinoplanes derwentensis]
MPIKRVVAPQIDFSGLRRELGLPEEFPGAVLAEAGEAVRATPLPLVDRTGIEFLTIDPAESRDLDQAMHLSRLDGGGYRVCYAIADVASYVRPGGAVEAESWVRGQTIYLPDGRIPLHPPVLSEDAVSLLPGVERAAVVWTIDLDGDGAMVAVDVERGRIRSRAKLDYAGVQRLIDAGEAPEALALLPEIGGLLARRAADRGAVNLPLPSQEVERDEAGGGWRLVLRAPLPIEEYNAQISLLTGMAAARIMLGGGVGLLRTMPSPRPEAVAKLRAAAEPLGISWPDGAAVGVVVAAVDPADPRGAAFLDQAAELLRGAGYTAFDATALPAGSAEAGRNGSGLSAVPGTADAGHGGVGAPYAHVTAPLRRLADRYATEICLALHAGRAVPEWVTAALPRLPKAMSSTDRVASAADRGAIDLTEAVLLQGRVGEEFDAAVLDRDEPSAKRPAGGSIALDDPAVRAKCLGDLPLGQRIRVRLTAADPASRTVGFERL